MSPKGHSYLQKLQIRSSIDAPSLPDHRLQIVIGPVFSRQTRIERPSRFAPRFAVLIGFQRPLNDVGDRPVLTPSQTMREIARFRTSDRQLGFGRKHLLTSR
jgi:hypothetical protein